MIDEMNELYRKHEEVVLYIFFGVLTTLVNWGSYAFFVWCGIDIVVSNIISWIVGVLFAFTVNKWFVFKSRNLTPIVVLREMGSFVTARILTGVLASWILFPILVYNLGMNQTIFGTEGFVAKIFTTILETVLNWLFSKFLIFGLSKKMDKSENNDQSDQINKIQ